MIQAAPEIPCVDFWPQGIPDTRLPAYRAMIDAGMITKPRCVIQKTTGSCVVSYLSTVPQDWLRQEMAEITRILMEG